ncbi:hypothetical protein [Thiocystis minor]|uniref:hypothetical protein n=1 Tax=Thiocystis minor TaxID=61597 RepID=UPI00191198A6|nr:hypothetical protein [Thiocystis minor]
MTATPLTNNHDDNALVEKAVTILVRELGSVDAGRFLAMPPRQRMESVKRHQAWQQGLNQTRFFDDVFGDQR